MKWEWTVLSAAAAFFTGVVLTDNHCFRCRNYVIESDKLALPGGKRKVRVISLADLHDQCFGRENRPLIDKVRRLSPDIILIPGDLITVKGQVRMAHALELVKALSDVAPVYYALGNHELRLLERGEQYGVPYETFAEQFRAAGAVILENESAVLDDYGVRLTGYTVPKRFYKKFKKPVMRRSDVEASVGKMNASTGKKEASAGKMDALAACGKMAASAAGGKLDFLADETCDAEDACARKDAGAAAFERTNRYFQILLAHNPEGFPAYAAWGADLTLSGHIHGGLVKLPGLGGLLSPSFELFPKYDQGLFERGGKKMVLSCGLGTHTLPIRVFNPGELTVIDLVPGKHYAGTERKKKWHWL